MQTDLLAKRLRDLITHLADAEAELRDLTSDQLDAVIDPHDGRLILLHEAQEALRQAESRYRQLAHLDTLTGLPNRLLFMSRLEHAIEWAKRDGSRVGVMFVDLDRFKSINDDLGHHVGDGLLREVGRRVAGCVRAIDTVARFGGDEFLVLFEGVFLPEDAAVLAEKIIASIEAPFRIEGNAIETTASIGISLYPDDGEGGEGLIAAADTAMYRAKAEGGNTYRFSTNVGLERDTARHGALQPDRSHPVLRFRPVVKLGSGAVTGMQCFARVGQHVGGPFGERLLREAFRQARAWRQAGIASLRYAIVLPDRQPLDSLFLDKVERALADSGLQPGSGDLALEVRESALKEAAARIGARLSAAGLRLLITGFGAGYSSLADLQRLPLAGVVVDRAFVEAIAQDPGSRGVVRAIAALAHGLGTRAIAGGVCSDEQLALLGELGCDEAQGPLFGKLLAAGEALRMLQRSRSKRPAS